MTAKGFTYLVSVRDNFVIIGTLLGPPINIQFACLYAYIIVWRIGIHTLTILSYRYSQDYYLSVDTLTELTWLSLLNWRSGPISTLSQRGCSTYLECLVQLWWGIYWFGFQKAGSSWVPHSQFPVPRFPPTETQQSQLFSHQTISYNSLWQTRGSGSR